MKRVLAVLLSAVLSLSVAVVPGIQTLAEEPDAAQKTEGQQEAEVEVQAPSAVLMEASTGAVLYEKGCRYKTRAGQCHEDHDYAFDL